MTDDLSDNDSALLATLGNALATARSVPLDFIATGKACFAWHGIESELAQLVHDSSLESAAVRADHVVRSMTFEAGDLIIELEINDQMMRGQFVPHQTGRVELELLNGEKFTTEADELGYFTFDRVAMASFRLHTRTFADQVVSTPWVTM